MESSSLILLDIALVSFTMLEVSSALLPTSNAVELSSLETEAFSTLEAFAVLTAIRTFSINLLNSPEA